MLWQHTISVTADSTAPAPRAANHRPTGTLTSHLHTTSPLFHLNWVLRSSFMKQIHYHVYCSGKLCLAATKIFLLLEKICYLIFAHCQQINKTECCITSPAETSGQPCTLRLPTASAYGLAHRLLFKGRIRYHRSSAIRPHVDVCLFSPHIICIIRVRIMYSNKRVDLI